MGGYDSTLDTGSGTVCLWFKPASIGENSLVAFGANTGSRYDWNMRANCGGNELWGELGGVGGNVRASGVSYSTSAWIHLVVVQNGSSAVVYTNGVLSTSMDNQSGVWIEDIAGDGYTQFAVGGRFRSGFPNRSANGLIDDVRVYTQALAQASIDLIYNSGSGTESSLDDLIGDGGGGETNYIDDVSITNVYNAVITNGQILLSIDLNVTNLYNETELSNLLLSNILHAVKSQDSGSGQGFTNVVDSLGELDQNLDTIREEATLQNEISSNIYGMASNTVAVLDDMEQDSEEYYEAMGAYQVTTHGLVETNTETLKRLFSTDEYGLVWDENSDGEIYNIEMLYQIVEALHYQGTESNAELLYGIRELIEFSQFTGRSQGGESTAELLEQILNKGISITGEVDLATNVSVNTSNLQDDLRYGSLTNQTPEFSNPTNMLSVNADQTLEGELNDLDYEIELLESEHTQIIGLDETLGGFFSVEVPTVGQQSLLSLTVPWGLMPFASWEDKTYTFDLVNFPFISELRLFFAFLLYLFVFFWAIYIIRKGIA